MVKKEKKSPRGDKRRKDAPALIAELFRSLPDKRYSVKSLMAAVGATTRDEKERVRGIVRDLATEGVIEQVSEGKYRLSHSERETVEERSTRLLGRAVRDRGGYGQGYLRECLADEPCVA